MQLLTNGKEFACGDIKIGEKSSECCVCFHYVGEINGDNRYKKKFYGLAEKLSRNSEKIDWTLKCKMPSWLEKGVAKKRIFLYFFCIVRFCTQEHIRIGKFPIKFEGDVV